MVISSFNGSGSIYAVTTEGKAVQLSNGSWSELVDEGNTNEIRVKRISCCKTSLWAICGDHQVHLRLECDVPIRYTRIFYVIIILILYYYFIIIYRIREEAYENQRWNPIDSFCDKLLPTDRPFYSSQGNNMIISIAIVLFTCFPNHRWPD